MMSFETLGSEVVYQGRAFNVRKDSIQMPDGRTHPYDIVAHRGAVTIIPMDDQGNILFVRQFRPATGQMLLELPAGTLEDDEPPIECARREIREETGMAASDIIKVGETFLAPGYSTEFMHYFLATGLYSAPLPGDDDEYIHVEIIPVGEAMRMAREGGLIDAKSLVGLFLLEPFLSK
jgi:ADP-ribose pyrophosphatase